MVAPGEFSPGAAFAGDSFSLEDLVSDGGVVGTHAESTLHFFVGDECALIGVGSALIVRRYFWVRAGVRLDAEAPSAPEPNFDRNAFWQPILSRLTVPRTKRDPPLVGARRGRHGEP